MPSPPERRQGPTVDGVSSSPASSPSSDGPTVADWVSRSTGTVLLSTGALAAVVYGILRLASEEFYGPLGVSPDDVGLGRAELLARAAGIALFPLLLTLVIVMASIEIAAVRRLPSTFEKINKSAWWWAPGLYSIAAIALGSLWAPLAYLIVAPVFLIGVIGVLRRPITPRTGRRVLAVGAVLAALSIAFLFVLAFSHRALVLDGHGLWGWERRFAPWDATIASITWASSAPVPESIKAVGCGVYLGTGAGQVVIFDPNKDETLRIPASQVVIVLHPEKGPGQLECSEGKVVPAS